MIDFWGVGFDVAEKMGLVPRLRELGYVMDRIRFVDANDDTRSELRAEVLRAALGNRFISLPRGDLARSIYDLVEGKVATIFDDGIVSLERTLRGVRVEFARREPRFFDLVIGADGLHSKVRALVFGAHDDFERYLRIWVASFTTSGYPWRDEHAYVGYAAPGKQISRYSLRGDRSAFLITARSATPPAIDLRDLEGCKRLILETFSNDRWVEMPVFLEHLASCHELYLDTVSQIQMPKWSRGNVVLIGDAAYCPSLLAGQGAAFALLGAYVLASELARRPEDPQVALAAFERRLRPFMTGKQRRARRFASSFTPETRWGMFLILSCWLPVRSGGL